MFYRRSDSLLPVERRGVVPIGTVLWLNVVLVYDLSNISDK